MELFTLGVGNYTQTDVTEVARALTGWTVQNYTRATNYDAATFVDRADFHDGGAKTILGQTGNWNGYDALGIILGLTDASGSVSGRFLSAKLWAYFAGTDASAAVVDALQSVYVSSAHSVREVVRALFLRDEFWGPDAVRAWVRSPAEFAVAAVRMLEGQSDFSTPATSLPGMGENLFNPSDAKGWDWGTSWINTGSLFARATLANTLASNRGNTGTRFDPAALLSGQDASTADAVVDLLADRLNLSAVPSDVRGAWIDYVNANDDGSRGTWTNTSANVDKKVRGLAHVMLTSPDFQLA